MKISRIAALVFALAFALPLAAQVKKAPAAKSADSNMQILADKVKADKKLVVASNMQLSDADGKKFWPLYDGYQKELEGIYSRTAKVIADYADAYGKNAVNDELAKKLLPELLAIEEAQFKVRKTYADKITKALSAKAAARYLQIENKIRAVVNYALADAIPLVP
jgi:hypothetical protein